MKELFSDNRIRTAVAIFAFILLVIFVKSQWDKEAEEKRRRDAGKSSVETSNLEYGRDTYKVMAKRFVDSFKGVSNPINPEFGTDDDPRVSAMKDILLLNDDGIKQVANDTVAISGDTVRSWVEGDSFGRLPFIEENGERVQSNFLNRLSAIGL